MWLASLRCCGQPEVAVQACQCLAASQVQPEAALWALVAGMDTVLAAGVPVLEQSVLTGARPGRITRR